MSTENQRAGIGAFVAAGAGLLAVIAIVIAANQGTSPPSEDEPRSERVPEGSRRAGSARFPSMPMGHPGSAVAERARLSSSDAGMAPEGGVELSTMGVEGVEPPSAAGSAPPSAAGSTPPEPVRVAEFTPEQRYEAHAFLVDLVSLRIDTLRTEIADARSHGDAVRLRRLEPALATLEEEVVSLEARSRELERALGRHREPGEDGASDEEAPAEPTE